MGRDSKQLLFTLSNAMTVLRDLYPDLTLNQALGFLLVAQNPGGTISEMWRKAGLKNPAAGTRVVSLFSEWRRLGVQGLGLVDAVVDPAHRSVKRVYLTEKGRDVVGRMVGRNPPEDSRAVHSDAIPLELA